MQARPTTLAEVATRADSLERFGRELADWLHTLRTLGSRPALAATIAEEPALLASHFREGALADAALTVGSSARHQAQGPRQRVGHELAHPATYEMQGRHNQSPPAQTRLGSEELFSK